MKQIRNNTKKGSEVQNTFAFAAFAFAYSNKRKKLKKDEITWYSLTKIQEIQIRHWNTILYSAQKEASLNNLAQAEVALLYGATRPVVDLPIDDKHLPRHHPRVRSREGDLHNASGTTETTPTLRVIQREHGLKQTRSDDVAILSVSIIS